MAQAAVRNSRNSRNNEGRNLNWGKRETPTTLRNEIHIVDVQVMVFPEFGVLFTLEKRIYNRVQVYAHVNVLGL